MRLADHTILLRSLGLRLFIEARRLPTLFSAHVVCFRLIQDEALLHPDGAVFIRKLCAARRRPKKEIHHEKKVILNYFFLEVKKNDKTLYNMK